MATRKPLRSRAGKTGSPEADTPETAAAPKTTSTRSHSDLVDYFLMMITAGMLILAVVVFTQLGKYSS